MKTSIPIYLLLILSLSLASNTQAAKENFDRSTPTVQPTNGLENSCNGKKAKDVCKSQSSGGRAAFDYNSSRSNKRGIMDGGGHVTVLKAKMVNGGGEDLVLRKRPGRVHITPPTNCPTTKKSGKNQSKLNCSNNQ